MARRDDRDPPDWDARGIPPSELFGDELLDHAPPLTTPVRWGDPAVDELTWLTIAVTEPFDLTLGDHAGGGARRWWESVGDELISAAFQRSALDFEVTMRSWGVVFEVAFATDEIAAAFRHSDAMLAAIDQLGPLRLEVTSGRGGGGASVRDPRRGRPLRGSGAAALPLPQHDGWSPADAALVASYD